MKVRKQVFEVRTQAQWDRLVGAAEKVQMCILTAHYESDEQYTASIATVNWRELVPNEQKVITWHDKVGGDIAEQLPSKYQEFAELFSREAAEKLPARTENDMKIKLEPGKKLPISRLFLLS